MSTDRSRLIEVTCVSVFRYSPHLVLCLYHNSTFVDSTSQSAKEIQP